MIKSKNGSIVPSLSLSLPLSLISIIKKRTAVSTIQTEEKEGRKERGKGGREVGVLDFASQEWGTSDIVNRIQT